MADNNLSGSTFGSYSTSQSLNLVESPDATDSMRLGMAQNHVLTKFDCRPPTSSASISNYESDSGWLLPEDYKQFLRRANGGQGIIGSKSYVTLWSLEDLTEMNRAYET